MYSIIVVPNGGGGEGQFRLMPGEILGFGRTPHASPLTRGGDGRCLSLDHEGVAHAAGLITATGAFWTLSNLSRRQTYVVENPEGTGEHIRVAPGRADAPVPFEFARVVLPVGDTLPSFDVWAPRHDYFEPTEDAHAGTGQLATPAFPLDRTKRYFLVLVALCEPRLRGGTLTPLATTARMVERLRPVWPSADEAAVRWNLDYLAVKLGLRPSPVTAGSDPRLHGRRETLAALALRFDLVGKEDLDVLDAQLLAL